MEFKKKLKFRLYLAIGYITLGGIMMVLSFTGAAKNEMISSFGAMFAVVGIARIVQYMRIIKDESAIRAREIAETDERNIMIMTKARSLTFSVYIMLSGAAIIVLYLLNKVFIAQIIALVICALTIIYYICYHIIKRRY